MLRNIGTNWVVTVVTIGVTYFLMPFVLHTLGEDGYGSWMLINSITGTNARKVVVPGGGHAVHFDEPAAFNAALLKAGTRHRKDLPSPAAP